MVQVMPRLVALTLLLASCAPAQHLRAGKPRNHKAFAGLVPSTRSATAATTAPSSRPPAPAKGLNSLSSNTAPPANTAGSDAAMAGLSAALPRYWHLRIEGDRLVFERDGPIWVLRIARFRRFPRPRSSAAPESTEARVKRRGRKTTARVVFRLERRWSSAKLAAARRHNRTVARRLLGLADKHDVARIRSVNPHDRRQEAFEPTLPDDPRKIGAYLAERGRLRAARIKLPRFHSERSSLFPVSSVPGGTRSSVDDVVPRSIWKELARLEHLLRRKLTIVR